MEHHSASPRPFRFSVAVDHLQTRQEWLDKAHKAEDLGYSTFLVPDHTWINFDPIVGLTAVAEHTSLHIGSHVFCNDFRNPALLAQQVATLDLLSGGRFQLGLGCGYALDDYTHTGIPFDPIGTRLARLEEAVHLIKHFFSDDVLNFSGQYYQAQGMPAKPKPVQQPLPIYMGGAGKRVLSLAAREANIIGLVAKPSGTAAFDFDLRSTLPAANLQKLQWIRSAAGERFSQVELSTTIYISIVTSSNAQREAVAQQVATRSGLTPEEVLNSMNMLIGFPDQIIETLEERRELFGISCIEILEGGMEAFAPVVAKLTGK
ncbi:MAG: TIGR03621 family F420-dependent LLM class oxidoreductase [Ktedonobacteraceae bacterium]|nr:TIGR03621 family F420-dependent LLM class oxidoreductase [Ktedonobacteraceae bacterium]